MSKRILIVNDLLFGGGVEKLMFDLVWAWHDKYQITVMTDNLSEEFYSEYPENVEYIAQNPKYGILPKTNFFFRKINHFAYNINDKFHKNRLAKKLGPDQYDAVIAIKDGWKLLEVSKMNIEKKYAWVHTDYNSYYYTFDIFGGTEKEKECFQKFEKIVCVSEAIRQGLCDVIGDTGNLIVKYNPIHVAEIMKKADEPVVDIEEKKAGVVRFLTVGRLNYQKGFDLLLEACHMLDLDGLSYEVYVIGAEENWGDEHNRLYRAQKRLNLDKVHFLGGRKNPYKYMKHADWFLSTSVFEGYSLVSQEAAVLDLPLLLTDCSGVRELIGDNEYGIVAEKSVVGIYREMKRVIEKPELRDYYSAKIRERKEIITFEERLQELEKVLEE